MQKNILKLGTVLIAIALAAWVGVPPAFTHPAPVEVTGQTRCFDSAGRVIDCAGTGQDGEFMAGVPFPDPRFTNNRDGTVTDNLTELIWLRDASCNTLGPLMNGSASWQAALDAVNMLAAPACGLTDGSIPGTWRLPNVKELQSLIDFGRARPALPAGHQVFLDVKGAAYWSSTTYMITPTFAWIVDLQDGVTSRLSKRDARLFIWPVKGFPKK